MELSQYQPEKTVKSRFIPEMEEALIIPIGDIQYGSEACDWPRFKRHVEWAAAQPNAYFIGMGDYVDFASPSNRGLLTSKLRDGSLYDTVQTAMDEAAAKHLQDVMDVLEPTRGRWLGLLEGHHYWEFADGTTSDTRLCSFLDAPFLGTCAVVNVAFAPDPVKKNGTPSFDIWCHHGRGSGITGSVVRRLLQLMPYFPSVQVFLMAHRHKKEVTKEQQLLPVWGAKPTLRHRNVVLAGTGGFLRGYTVGSKRGTRAGGGYVEQAMMNPVALGGVVIMARPRYADGHSRPASVDIDVSI